MPARSGGPWPGPRRHLYGRRVCLNTYCPVVIVALELCWAQLDAPTGKVLVAALPDLVPNLLTHGVWTPKRQRWTRCCRCQRPPSIGGWSRPVPGLTVKCTSHTKPGSMLKSSIPQKTWSEWDNTVPGFLQIDLVGHDGGDNNGHLYFTLDATDVATGWTESITVRSKGERPHPPESPHRTSDTSSL